MGASSSDDPPARSPVAPVLRAALWMSGALVSLATMAVAGRELAATLTPFQVNVLLRAAVKYGELPLPEKKRVRPVLESLLAGIGQLPSMHLPKE